VFEDFGAWDSGVRVDSVLGDEADDFGAVDFDAEKI
jgi:hypothetical protein